MSTIRTTSDRAGRLPYTVVGGSQVGQGPQVPVSPHAPRPQPGGQALPIRAPSRSQLARHRRNPLGGRRRAFDGRRVALPRFSRRAVPSPEDSRNGGRKAEHRDRGGARAVCSEPVERHAAVRYSAVPGGIDRKVGNAVHGPGGPQLPTGTGAVVAVPHVEKEALRPLFPRPPKGRGDDPLSLRLLRGVQPPEVRAVRRIRPRHHQPVLAEDGFRVPLFPLGRQAPRQHRDLPDLHRRASGGEHDTGPGVQAVLAEEPRRSRAHGKWVCSPRGGSSTTWCIRTRVPCTR